MDASNSSSSQPPASSSTRNLLALQKGPGNMAYEGVLHGHVSPAAPVTARTSTSNPSPAIVNPASNTTKQRGSVRARKSEVPDQQLCLECNTRFAAGTHLLHLATHIPSGSNFCPFCSQTFTKQALDHLSVHSEDRPFACSVYGCEHAYKKKPHLDKHIATVHGGGEDAGLTASGTDVASDKSKKTSGKVGASKESVGEDVVEQPVPARFSLGRYAGDEVEDDHSIGYFSAVTGNYVGGGSGYRFGGQGGYRVVTGRVDNEKRDRRNSARNKQAA